MARFRPKGVSPPRLRPFYSWQDWPRPYDSITFSRQAGSGASDFMDAPPHYFLRADGSPAGFIVEAAELALKRRGMRYEWKLVSASPEQAFRDGLIDLFPDLTDLPSRRKQNIHFSAPWLQNDYSLLSLKSSGIVKAADTADRQVAYKGSIILDSVAERYLPGRLRIPTWHALAIQPGIKRPASRSF